jgi:lysophospholipase L1-like esterase
MSHSVWLHGGKIRRIMYGIALAMVAAMLVVGTPSSKAEPQSNWPIDYTTSELSSFLTLPDGSVVAGCGGGYSNRTVDAIVYDRDGNIKTTVNFNEPDGSNVYTCSHGYLVAAEDGTLFSERIGGSNSKFEVIATKDNAARWSTPLDVKALCGGSGDVKSMAYAKDQGLYILVGKSSGTCTSGYPRYNLLLRVDPVTGVVEQQSNVIEWSSDPVMKPYNGGVIVTGSRVSYVDYPSGAVTAVIRPSEGGARLEEQANPEGLTFSAIRADDPECWNRESFKKVVAYTQAGKQWEYVVPRCSRYGEVYPTPNGGVLLKYERTTTDQYSYVPELMALDKHGQPIWNQPYRYEERNSRGNYYSAIRSVVSVDNNGLIVLRRDYSSTQNWAEGTGYELIDLASARKVGEVLPADVDVNGDTYPLVTSSRPAEIGGGFIMARGWKANAWSSTTKLYRLPVQGLGMDYPRATWLGVTSVPFSEAKLVSLGDSFSSGEGVEPFDDDTNTAGPPENRCHRSVYAYPRLLGNNGSLGLNLQRFVACSGATTSNVENGQWNESSQFLAVDADSDIVTISVGGNDIGFRQFAEACVNPAINCDEEIYYDTISRIQNLPNVLSSVYSQVRSRAPRAKIYVVGYPLVVTVDSSGNPKTCWNTAPMTGLEVSAAYRILMMLDDKIREVVNSMQVADPNSPGRMIDDNRIYFVDPRGASSPFAEHDMCGTKGAYFNSLGLPMEYVFHPNQLGQVAYAQLLQEAMSRH